MEQPSPPDLPEHPKLRAVDPKWVRFHDKPYLYLRDPVGLAERTVLVPQAFVPLLSLCDGSRDLRGLSVALSLHTGAQMTPSQIGEFVAQLDEALLLENGAFTEASARALREYRDAPHRRPSQAEAVYPADAGELARLIRDLCEKAPVDVGPKAAPGRLVGMVCPHIDYARGGATYADLWQRAAPDLEDVEMAVILGTDHSGGPGAVTLTRQSYSTPFGVLPTDTSIVDGLVDLLGEEKAFAEEVHHMGEHSIELAAVWLHHFLGRPVPIVPVLCGTFHPYVAGDADLASDRAMGDALSYLKNSIVDRKALVVAAGDLAHVGPAFGDPAPVGPGGRGTLEARDRESLEAICAGDAEAFFELSRVERDARRICGLPPIYLTLRLLGAVRGEAVGYDQCAADEAGGSFVSIAGALLYDESRRTP